MKETDILKSTLYTNTWLLLYIASSSNKLQQPSQMGWCQKDIYNNLQDLIKCKSENGKLICAREMNLGAERALMKRSAN